MEELSRLARSARAIVKDRMDDRDHRRLSSTPTVRYARASLLADYVELLALKGQPVKAGNPRGLSRRQRLELGS